MLDSGEFVLINVWKLLKNCFESNIYIRIKYVQKCQNKHEIILSKTTKYTKKFELCLQKKFFEIIIIYVNFFN